MFSIVIPVYNAKASLERCVDSWLCQTRKDLEIILVDDGSSDGSGELSDRLAENSDGRVRTAAYRQREMRESGLPKENFSFSQTVMTMWSRTIWKRWQLCRKTVMQIWCFVGIIISMMVQIL